MALKHCIIALLLSLTPLSHLTAADEPPSQADLDAITEAISRVETRIENTSSERSDVESQLQETEQAISSVNSRIREVEQALAEERRRLEALQEEQARLEASRSEQQSTIARYLRSAWRGGRAEYLKLLLNQEDIARSNRMLQYYRHFNQARAERIAEWNRTLAAMRDVAADIAETNRTLAQRQQQLEEERSNLEASQENRETLLAELETVLEESGEELARLEGQREELALLIEELNRSVNSLSTNTEPFAELKGRLPWPTDSGRLLNSFGSRHSQGDLIWQGVNISVPAGTEVRAIHHGRVVYADWFGSSGLLLIIDHGDGYMSLYAQNQELFHDVGDWVNSGAVIATAGDTGGQREAGLYFEIRHNGQSRDPVAWCEARD